MSRSGKGNPKNGPMPPAKDSSKTRSCPYEKANTFSKSCMWWVTPMLFKGYNKELEMEDLWDIPRHDESEHLGDQLQRHFHESKSLLKAIFKTFGLKMFKLTLIALLEETVIKLSQPLLMMYLMRYFSGDHQYTRRDGYLFSSGIVAASVLFIFVHHRLFLGTFRLGMKTRVACCSLIYRKAVTLSQGALGQTTTGQMVNLLSNDVQRFDMSFVFIPHLIAGPLQSLISVGIIGYFVSWPVSVAGFTALFLIVPLQTYLGKVFSKFRLKTAGKTDERVRLMSEILDGMRIIKMYAWEKPFAEKVDFARRAEVKVIQAVSFLRGFNMAMFFMVSRVVLLVTFVTFVLIGEKITAEKVFLTVATFNTVRLMMTYCFPNAIGMGAETLVSCKRLENFLLLSERVTPPDFFLPDASGKLSTNIFIEDTLHVENISASWNPESGTETLSDISLTIGPGELVAVVGMVGAGKSSLLQAILRELPLTKGTIRCPKKIGYTAQEAWVFAGTIEENILLSRPMDEVLFKKVVRACAFDVDLNQFPSRQKTFVGDRGVTLSGGQKARLSLARALYQEADLYLLDDPLSAVDAHVGRHLFDFCIMKYLKDKPRLLVTHQLQFLSKADKIIVLHDGRVRASGSMQDLKKAGIDVNKYIAQEDSTASPEQKQEGKEAAMTQKRKRNLSTSSAGSVMSATSFGQFGIEGNQETLQPLPPLTHGQVAELRSEGQVEWKTYWTYFKAGASYPSLIFVIICNILAQIAFSGSDMWLSYWTNMEAEKNTTIPESEYIWYERTYGAMYIYAGIVLSLILLSLVRSWHVMSICMKASVNLHSKMFNSVLRAPMKFFDNNPVGRTLNRFSRDTGNMDELLPTLLLDVVLAFLSILGVVAVIAIVNPWMVIPSLITCFIVYYTRKFYLATSRQIKRLEGTSRSPVFSHLAATLQGLDTIRACKVETDFCHRFDYLQDQHSKAFFLFLSTSRWLGVALDILVAVYLACVTYSFMIAESQDAGVVGLAISSAVTVTGMLQWGSKQSAEMENQFTSVERIIEYTDLPPEAELDSRPDKKPNPSWPAQGGIKLENVGLTYDTDPDVRPVLSGLNLEIHPREKIGIVGRTGAGKSSFIVALFRLVEPFGTLTIDGIDTKSIGLHDLRQKLSIIPQEPVLFAGSVRKNLDPFSKSSDDQLWDALEQVQLKEPISQLSGGLEAMIADRGTNFSVGQRQLICLARAILNKNRILILDEATANVDLRTDQLIQQALRTKFVDCTTITIAHRLDTIIDSDRIIVLEAGRLAQFGSPHQLLQDKSGIFHKLLQQTGPNTFKSLYLQAAEAYEKKHHNEHLNTDPANSKEEDVESFGDAASILQESGDEESERSE
ncbi:unnamed protein product [Cyprideis torosa]|uniref:Uncharacterized protein n=1 Tax=Cyprideis torosa TaxID=163714 RepID=A0A7R8WIY5_9CRUS|nr:unnamed protein product [Cyprideis torosa]CAG0895339.1 unnamed protein product [Cyprideis torosa]